MATMQYDDRGQPVVPVEYGGKWIAWSKDASRILGAGETPEEAEAAASPQTPAELILEWVPPSDEMFVGSI